MRGCILCHNRHGHIKVFVSILSGAAGRFLHVALALWVRQWAKDDSY